MTRLDFQAGESGWRLDDMPRKGEDGAGYDANAENAYSGYYPVSADLVASELREVGGEVGALEGAKRLERMAKAPPGPHLVCAPLT